MVLGVGVGAELLLDLVGVVAVVGDEHLAPVPVEHRVVHDVQRHLGALDQRLHVVGVAEVAGVDQRVHPCVRAGQADLADAAGPGQQQVGGVPVTEVDLSAVVIADTHDQFHLHVGHLGVGVGAVVHARLRRATGDHPGAVTPPLPHALEELGHTPG